MSDAEELTADVCQDCQIRSQLYLNEVAEKNPELKKFTNKRANALNKEAESKRLCAMRDPKYQNEQWCYYFIPIIGRAACVEVTHEGELCPRCRTEIQRQLIEDPEALPYIRQAFENNERLGFECVMSNARYKDVGVNMDWKRGFVNEIGAMDEQEISDFWYVKGKHVCCRASRKDGVCDTCFARMSVQKQFHTFFDNNSTLRPQWIEPS
jgi:hypothetical protein